MALAGGAPRLGLALALTALVAAVYWPVREHAWLDYDDPLITTRPEVALGLSREGLAWAFTSYADSNWFPLTRLSWLFDHAVAGLDAKQFHTTNLWLHATATAALFLALSRLTGARRRSAFAAAIFGLHPLAVEPVAWAAGRKDPLAGLCFALSLWAYAACDGRLTGLRSRVAVMLPLLAGLMSKPSVVTLPFVLLLLDVWPLGRLRSQGRWQVDEIRGALREKLPLFALVACAAAATYLAQSSGGVVAGLERLPFDQRLANAAVALASYLLHAAAPVGLGVFYPHPGEALPAGRVAAASTLLAALAALAWRLRRRAPACGIGLLWFAGMLVPMLGLVQVGDQAMADRYMYLPIVGLAIALTWTLPELPAPGFRSDWRSTALRGGGVAIVAALAWATTIQLAHWRDTETLMRHTLRVTGDNYVAHTYLGVARLRAGDAEATIRHWREAARIQPGYATVANNLAWLLATHPDPALRDGAEAVRLAERATALTDDAPETLDTLAAAYAEAGRFREARRVATRARGAAAARGDDALAAAIEARLARYRTGGAWRETPSAGG